MFNIISPPPTPRNLWKHRRLILACAVLAGCAFAFLAPAQAETSKDVSEQTSTASQETAAASVELARLGSDLQGWVGKFRV